MAISHGTTWGYKQELQAGLTTCQSCRAAWCSYIMSLYVPKTRKQAKCGTTGGYQKHRRLKEATCQPCRDAWNKDWKDRQQKKKEATYGHK